MDEVLSDWMIWLILAAVLIVIELLTNTFAAFCLVGGCVVALIMALIGLGLEVQIAGAVVGTVIAFIAFLPLIKKQRQAKSHSGYQSNMDALIGRTATVTEPIQESKPGRVKIDGDNWQVITADKSPIATGEQVKVVGYDSIILTVERIRSL